MLMPPETYPEGYPTPGDVVRTPRDGFGVVVPDDDQRITHTPEGDRQVTWVPLVELDNEEVFKGWWAMGALAYVDRPSTAAERITEGGRTQPLTSVEEAFFGVPDHMVKPRPETSRVPIEVDPATRKRLRSVLTHDSRFNGDHGNGIGYSEFINRALDALGCEG